MGVRKLKFGPHDDLPAPTGLIELSMCSCKSPCQTDRCMCRKNKLLCTEMCKCVDTCKNCDNDDTEYLTDSEEEDSDFED